MRKGPEESATLFSVGIKKKGNDGNMWMIVKNKNGVKRWQKSLFKKKRTKKKKRVGKSPKTMKRVTGKKYLIFHNIFLNNISIRHF